MIIEDIYQFLGQSIITILILIAILLVVAIILGLVVVKKKIMIFPKLIIFLNDVFYSPLKKLFKALNFDENLVDTIGIEVRNGLNEEPFKEIPPEETLIFLPHCLRHRDCEAVLQEQGLICTDCKKCSIGVIKRKSEPLGYKLYIVPGSSFVKKIVKENKFKAVIGVACHEDLSQTMMLLSDYCPQGVLLTRTGCFETKVDVKTILELINSKNCLKEEE